MAAAEESEVTPKGSSKFRTFTGPWRVVAIGFPAIAIIFGIVGVFHIRPFGQALLSDAYLYMLATLFLPLCFFWIPAHSRARRDRLPWYDIILMILSCGRLSSILLAGER